jgi:hypothetical protein
MSGFVPEITAVGVPVRHTLLLVHRRFPITPPPAR